MRRLLHSEVVDVRISLSQLEVKRIKRCYSELLDRSAQAVFQAGFDLDDVIVERFLLCTDGGRPARPVAAEPLSDEHGLRRTIQQVLNADSADDVHIVGLGVNTTLDR